MRSFSIFIFIALTMQSQDFNSQNSRLRTGDKPQLKISEWIANVPNDKNLTGKFIVLEFWATWCKPFLESAEHLNDLQSKFNNPNLYFISLTDENVEIVKNTLKKTKFNSIVVSDTRFINSFWNG